MSLAVLYSRALVGMDAPLVTVEVHLANGLPSFTIVGLPETEVKESKDRVRAALLNAQFEFPMRRITVNLAPADLPKESGRFDLPIALGILAASGQLPTKQLAQYEFAGELALTGELRPIRGALAMTYQAAGCGRCFVLPRQNAQEAALVKLAKVLPADALLAVCAHLNGRSLLDPYIPPPATPVELYPDLNEVKGQQQAKRALQIAAAGGHNLLMMGPPGTGKSMLAHRLPGIMPSMTEAQALETAALQSLASGGFKSSQWLQRPFRAPHHTASSVALVGGGGQPKPGEISLAHHGVLFLDELPEFDRKVLEVLREPLESGVVSISRAARQATFPAQFQLVAAMNPCPCGHFGNPRQACRCTPDQVQRYRGKVSAPFLDRIDLQIEVPTLPAHELTQAPHSESSITLQGRVEQAYARQLVRQNKPNARLSTKEIDGFCQPDAPGKTLLEQAMNQLHLSARAYHRILKVARTIADLEGATSIHAKAIAEAIQYRKFDRMRVSS